MPSPIRAILLLVFIAIPLLEIALLIKVGQSIGFWWTVLIVVGTAAIGTTLLHRQGLETLRRLMDQAKAAQPPVKTLIEGGLLLAAGLLLLTPGLITDTVGLVLLIPIVRSLLADRIIARAVIVATGAMWENDTAEAAPKRAGTGGSGRPGSTGGEDGIIIEGEFERLDERTMDPNKPGPSRHR